MKTLFAVLFVAGSVLLAENSVASFSGSGRPFPIFIRLKAQVWEKKSTRTGDAKYDLIGSGESLSARIPLHSKVTFVKREMIRGDLVVLVTFYQVTPEIGLPYISTQTRLIHRVRGLLAECSRYDALASPDIGIGSCSGVLDGHQIGVSFLKD